jgi:RND family efflux transporter MFP subunit
MKKMFVILLTIVLIFSLIGCQGIEETPKATVKAVSVEALRPRIKEEVLNYFGIVEAETIKKYALKTSGILDSLFVSIGDSFEKDSILARIDDYEYTVGEAVSREKLSQSETQLVMIKESLDFYKKSFEDAKILLASGSISQNKFDEIKLYYEIKEKEYLQALANVEQADLSYNLDQRRVDDTVLKADMDGIVVDILNEEGELVSQGYPLIIGRSKKTKVTCGITAKEREYLSHDQKVIVTVNNEDYMGRIESIGLTPDEQTRTYPLDISVEETLTIGQNAKIKIPIKSTEGIWLNITTILNDGIDYVYIIEDNRAVRKEITLGSINGEEVLVNGLSQGDQLVIKGQSTLSEGQLVEIKGEDNDSTN